MSDPIREAQRARVAEFKRQHPTPAAPARRPEAVALEELVAAIEAHLAGSHADEAWHVARSRVVLALNAARNALRKGREIDGIVAHADSAWRRGV